MPNLKRKSNCRPKPKKNKKAEASDDAESSDSECEEVAELPKMNIMAAKPKARQSVSAEAFGKYNAKEVYTLKEVKKSDDTKQRIKARLTNSFMFKALNKEDLEIVVGAMAEKHFKKGENVIV